MVNVASNAPPRFINTVTTSGGGEVNFSNSAATDVAGGQSPQRRGDPTSISSGTSAAVVLDNVANAFTRSHEYFATLVMQDYLQLLHRTPSAAEVSSWVNLLTAGLSDEQVLAGFASSTEYYQQAGGNNQAWVDTLYRDVLGRSADAAGEANWLQALASGAGYFNVALAVATSVEHESNIVAADYQRFLGRSANAAEVAGWVSQLQQSMSIEQMAAAFLASEEFYADQGSTLPSWLNGAYQVVLQRDPDAIGFNNWDTYLENQLGGG
jgi:hypothetical protein